MSEETFTYESSRLVNLMREYSKLTTIGECRTWACKAQTVVTYMSDTIVRTDQVMLIQKERLGQEQNKSEQTNLRMSLMQLANFRQIVARQVDELSKIIDSLPTGTDENEKAKLPKRQVYAVRLDGARYKKRSFVQSLLIMIIAIVIFALLLMYLSSL
jgi:hypothetical protein